MDAKLTKEELFKKAQELFREAQERFSSWARMYSNPDVTAQQMYEDMSNSCYFGNLTNDKPVLDESLCFSYKGYDFELSSCNSITHRNQIVGLTVENIKERFPNDIFSDRYVCWMYGHKNCGGYTKEELENPEFFAPNIYLVPEAWSWGANDDLKPGAEVSKFVLECIDKFLETFKE